MTDKVSRKSAHLTVDTTPQTSEVPSFTPAPSFSLARTSSFRYPGWNAASGEKRGTREKRRGSLTSPPSNSGSFPPTPNSSSPVQEEQKVLLRPQHPPKKPLSRDRLARIANALGVQAPAPAGPSSSRSTSATHGKTKLPVSAAPNYQVNNTATRFLLHVIPPVSLQPPGNEKFMRGTFIPLHATLPSQLTAIAREYALPSTGGIVVYLLDATHSSFGEDGIGDEWLGPKVGEEAWKLLWSAVIKAEREAHFPTPRLPILSPGMSQSSILQSSQSSPSLSSHPSKSTSQSSNSLPSPPGTEKQLSTADTTPQDSPRLKPTPTLRPLRMAPPNQQSPSLSPMLSSSMIGPPMQRSDSPASVRTTTTTTSTTSMFLPALPIVGKIEFDIERHKATWYDTWQPRQRSRTETSSSALLEGGMSPSIVPAPIPRSFIIGTTSRSVSPSLSLSPLVGTGSRRTAPSPLQPTPDEQTSGAPSSSLLTPASAQFPSQRVAAKVPRNSLLLDRMQDGSGSEYSQEEAAEEAGFERGVDSELESSPLQNNGYAQLSDADGSTYSPSQPGLSPNVDFDDEEGGNEMDGSPSHLPLPSDEESLPSTSPETQHKDPLGDVFPSDSQTWDDIREAMGTSRPSDHPDRAAWVGGGDDISEGLPSVEESSAADFQEVLDMMNAASTATTPVNTSKGSDAQPPSTPTAASTSPTTPPALTLGSPIVLENKPVVQIQEFQSPDPASPESTKSTESKGSRRPAPLTFVPPELVPVLADIAPTPGTTPTVAKIPIPGSNAPRPGNEVTTSSTSDLDLQTSGDGHLPSMLDMSFYDDNDDDGTAMSRTLDDLEKSISQLSPRELSPTPPPILSPRRSMPGSVLNGFNGPRFRSEALGAELASRIERQEGRFSRAQTPPHIVSLGASGGSPPEHMNGANWPAIPFASVATPTTTSFPTTPTAASFNRDPSNPMSEETRMRAELAAQEDEISGPRKYRPPTPHRENEDQVPSLPSFVPSERNSSLTSPPKKSRFSNDSTISEDGTVTSTAVSGSSSVGRTTSIMSRSIRKLWRKSGAAAQVVSKANSSRQSTQSTRASSPPPPMPQAPLVPSNQQHQGQSRNSDLTVVSSSSSRQSRPDSSLDPFVFDQESRYPTLRSPSPSSAAKSQQVPQIHIPHTKYAPSTSSSISKTRSILKGRRTSPPPPESTLAAQPPAEEKSLIGFFGRRRSNTATSQHVPSPEEGPVEARHDDDSPMGKGKKKKAPPANLTTNGKGLPSILPSFSPSSAFPKTASPRGSFDLDDRRYIRPSIESSNGSQFEIVTPPMRSFDLEDQDRIAKPLG